MPCVVADTSPLFYLARLGRLEILRELYGVIEIPPAVWKEALAGGRGFPEIFPLLQAGEAQGWLHQKSPALTGSLSLTSALDDGEREAIHLAQELHAELILMDEQLGRRIAEELGLTVTGTLGILVEAKERKLIPSLRHELQHLRTQTSFRFSIALENQILALAGESPDS